MQYIDYIIQHYGWQGATLAAAMIILFFIQLHYHIVVYGRVARFLNSRRRKKLDTPPAVSVIVPIFAEDYDYLDTRLHAIMSQQYEPGFEVVLVYVGADNDYFEELNNMRLRFPNLIITKIQYNPRFPITVKMALNVGIKSAHNEHILITTTDSTPRSEQWISIMGKAFIAKDKKVAQQAEAAKAVLTTSTPAAPEADKPTAPGTAGQLKLHDVEPKTAAMLMAIVADKMGKPINELRFISIKEVK